MLFEKHSWQNRQTYARIPPSRRSSTKAGPRLGTSTAENVREKGTLKGEEKAKSSKERGPSGQARSFEGQNPMIRLYGSNDVPDRHGEVGSERTQLAGGNVILPLDSVLPPTTPTVEGERKAADLRQWSISAGGRGGLVI